MCKKTKEMLVDFRRQSVVDQLSIDGVVIERVDSYKYLDTVLDHKLTFSDNTDAIFKKRQNRLFLQRKLRKMDMNSDLLQSFYRCWCFLSFQGLVD